MLAGNVYIRNTDYLLFVTALMIFLATGVYTAEYRAVEAAQFAPVRADDVHVDKLHCALCIAFAQIFLRFQAQQAGCGISQFTSGFFSRKRNMKLHHITFRIFAVYARVRFSIFHSGVNTAAAF